MGGGGGRKVFQHVPIPHGHVSALFTRDFTSYAELAPAGEAHEVLTPRGATTAMMAVEGEQAGGRLGSLGGMSGIPQLAEGRSPCHDGGCGQPGDGAFRGFSVGFPARRPALPGPHSLPSGARGGRGADYISQNARGGGGEPASSREEESAEVARRGPEAPLPWRREPGPGPTMAETDPKTVQDLTAVVSPPGLGQPPRGVRGEAGSGERGAEPPPWGEAPAGRGRSLRPGPVGGPWRYLPGPSLGNPRLPAVGGAAGLVVSPGSFPRVVA